MLGPVVDVGSSETGSALGSRVYSDDPDEVATYADAVVRAYRAEHVFSSAAHFPGLGATDQSTQDGPATVGLGLDELRQRDLVPFRAAIDAGVPGVTIALRALPVQRLHRAGLAVARGGHDAAAAATCASRAWR